MNRNIHCLSLLILTEDGASDSHGTITAVVKKMLRIVDRSTQTHRIEFEPQGDNAKLAMVANHWKSRNPRDLRKIVDLRRSIATKLVEGGDDVPGFVIFHFDGDRTWGSRDKSENIERFAEFASGIRLLVEKHLSDRDVLDELENKMLRLRPLIPFYSIEAWLYQNVNQAVLLCNANCGQHIQQIRSWAIDRSQLDEVDKPKSSSFCCLGPDHNLQLAENVFPAREVHTVGKSFTAAVDSLAESGDLIAALKRTHDTTF